ncbi:hypothetical protein ABL78_0418 [Leptomonas seymouri]|uniref:Uncharacterized protein n=1 Tax=Leptomonas seymouri TaxID=5684 RepID=A0A0N1IAB5_LEPSE|nr:hypothetical protein ABL78_0418 [Leptomonas seymouri]|eukprot:KPI90488.1 hypothetical protein ABL78_0418 [Leptomonas seymouri]
MSVLQKIFSPGSSKKKNMLLHSDVEASEKNCQLPAKASASTRIKRKPSDERDDGTLGRSVSTTVNCDPVPLSFKTNPSFANHSRIGFDPSSPESFRAHASPGANGQLDRLQRHTTTNVKTIPPSNRKFILEHEPVKGYSSLAVGNAKIYDPNETTNNGATNLWRLPWTQQKVVMCPNCHRPRKTEKATTNVPQASNPNHADDMSEANEVASSRGSDPMAVVLEELATYCRCKAAVEAEVPEPASAVITPTAVEVPEKKIASLPTKAQDASDKETADASSSLSQAYSPKLTVSTVHTLRTQFWRQPSGPKLSKRIHTWLRSLPTDEVIND